MSTQSQHHAYRGWDIYKWTGWHGCYGKTVATKDHSLDLRGDPVPCHICGLPIMDGVFISRALNRPDCHWLCAFPENPDESYCGQWVAMNPGLKEVQKSDHECSRRYCYVNVPAAGEGLYERGGSFDIRKALNIVTFDTSEDEKDRLKAEGLQRMYVVIDEIEAAA